MSNLIGNLLGGGGYIPPIIDEEDPPIPVPLPLVFAPILYLDHVTRGLNRLCQQFRSDETE